MATKATKKKSGGKYSSIPGAGRFAKSTLDKVYKRGLGAYFSSGSRPRYHSINGLWAESKALLVVKVVQEKLMQIY